MRISDWSSDVCSSDLHRRLLDDALAPQGAFVAVPALAIAGQPRRDRPDPPVERGRNFFARARSEEHTSELQSLMRISYAVFCLKKKKVQQQVSTQQTLNQTQYRDEQ